MSARARELVRGRISKPTAAAVFGRTTSRAESTNHLVGPSLSLVRLAADLIRPPAV